jgi:hypothetical protein
MSNSAQSSAMLLVLFLCSSLVPILAAMLLHVIEEAKKEEEKKKEMLAETMASVSLRLKRHLEGKTPAGFSVSTRSGKSMCGARLLLFTTSIQRQTI